MRLTISTDKLTISTALKNTVIKKQSVLYSLKVYYIQTFFLSTKQELSDCISFIILVNCLIKIMPVGRLEVFLASAKGLENADFFFEMDPYVIITCRSQEQKSSVATDGGSTPEWNETFAFSIYGDVPELHLKIMDKDTFTDDDFVGEAR
ncbi:hypothetical protein RND81_01G198600 [Saponaria officinalis]